MNNTMNSFCSACCSVYGWVLTEIAMADRAGQAPPHLAVSPVLTSPHCNLGMGAW